MMYDLSDLPPAMLTEIFVKLPVRTLVTLKCVCKTFLYIIDDYEFARLHFNLFNKNNDLYNKNHDQNDDNDKHGVTNLILIEHPLEPGVLKAAQFSTIYGDKLTRTNAKFEVPFNWEGYTIEVVGSVHGLFLLHKFKSRKWESTDELVLWNPSIRKTLSIPQSPASMSKREQFSGGDFGLGYDPLIDDYKAVAILLPDHRTRSGLALVEVYSLRNGSWRSFKIEEFPVNFLGHKVYYNGAIHWVAGVYDYDDEDEEDGHFTSHLVSFNLTSESFTYTVLPIDLADGPLNKVKFPVVACESVTLSSFSDELYWIWKLGDDGWDNMYAMSGMKELYDSLMGRRISNGLLFTKYCVFLISLHGQGFLIADFFEGEVKFDNHGTIYIDTYVESLLWKPAVKPSCIGFHGENGTGLIVVERPVEAGMLAGAQFVTHDGHELIQTAKFRMPIDWGYTIEVMGCVNGLLLMHKIKSPLEKWVSTELILCDPLTEKSLIIPPSPASLQFGSGSWADLSFGYDPVNNDYKIVAAVHRECATFVVIDVYSVRRGSWKMIEREGSEILSVPDLLWLRHKVYLDGVIYWIMVFAYHPNEDELDYCIVSVDLKTEECQEVGTLPEVEEECPKKERVNILVVVDGSLAVCSISPNRTWVWVLELQVDSWIKAFDCDSKQEWFDFLRVRRVSNAIFFKESSVLLISLHGQGVVSFNYKTHTIKSHNHGATYVGTFAKSFLWKELLPQLNPNAEAMELN